MSMKLTELFLTKLEREAPGTRSVLERVPEGRNDWNPHEKSMRLGYLAALVAAMPSWIAMIVDRDELDIASAEGSKFQPQELSTRRELLQLFEQSLARGREALANTTDEHLMKPWKFVVAGRVVNEEPRYIALDDSVFSHLAHHRGQLTVYLRLNGAPVPAVYGPSADEGQFARSRAFRDGS